MGKVTLKYDDFGQWDLDPFEYEVEVDFASFLDEYLDVTYRDVGVAGAVDDLVAEDLLKADKREEALQCKSLTELANYIINVDHDLAEEIVENNYDFVSNYVERDDTLLEDNREDAYAEYKDDEDGSDPDGFGGWDDYLHWKNGF